MKYLFPIGLLIAGLAIGYGVGVNSSSTVVIEPVTENQIVKTEVVYDTIVKHEIVNILSENEISEDIDTLIIDTVSVKVIELDTLKESYLVKMDSLDSIQSNDEQLSIKSDKKLDSKRVDIIYLKQTTDKDSLLKTILNINEVTNKTILLEFWESPINYKGYKLSKSKLIVYGLSPQFTYHIYKDNSNYYLNFQNIFYKLQETNDFLAFKSIDKSEVIND